MLLNAITLVTTWAAFAFGGVYPWAYWPVIVAATTIGLIAVINYWRHRPPETVQLLVSVSAIIAVVAFELLPLPSGALETLSPTTGGLLAQYDLAYAAQHSHAISIDPSSTARALAFLVSLSILLFGTVCLLSRTGASPLVVRITTVAVILALAGIIQRATTDIPYGFWMSLEGGRPFGPFVNRSHFAGWMLMAVPLAVGGFWSKIAESAGRIKPGWRSRLVWFTTPAASQAMLFGAAVPVMALSLMLTRSRSGVLCFALAVTILAGFAGRQRAGAGRLLKATYLGALILTAFLWSGIDEIAVRFAAAPASGWGGRVGAWADAIGVWRRFPVVGTGVNTYSRAMLFYQRFDLDYHYSEAHNDFLQIAAEGGLLLLLPIVVGLVQLVLAIRARFRDDVGDTAAWWLRAGAVTGLAAIGLQEIGEFSLQIPANALLFVLLIAVAIHRSPTRRRHVVTC